VLTWLGKVGGDLWMATLADKDRSETGVGDNGGLRLNVQVYIKLAISLKRLGRGTLFTNSSRLILIALNAPRESATLVSQTPFPLVYG
jgi:hypothetical protein